MDGCCKWWRLVSSICSSVGGGCLGNVKGGIDFVDIQFFKKRFSYNTDDGTY